jgi:hypothetical protein
MGLTKNELIEINSLIQQDNDLLLTHTNNLIRANAKLLDSNANLEKRLLQATDYNTQLRAWIERMNERLTGRV